MKPLNTALLSVMLVSGAALSTPCFAQATATKPALNLGADPLPDAANGNQASDPATGNPYMPLSGMSGTTAPQSSALDQVNLGGMPASDPQDTTSPQ